MGLTIPIQLGIFLLVLIIVTIIAAIRWDNKKRKKPNFVKDVYTQTSKYGANKTFKNNDDGTFTFKLQSRLNKTK